MDEFVMVRSASHRREDTESDVDSLPDSADTTRTISFRDKVTYWRASSFKSMINKQTRTFEDENDDPLTIDQRTSVATLKRKHQSLKKLSSVLRTSKFSMQQEKLNSMLNQRLGRTSNLSNKDSGRFNLGLTDSSNAGSDNPLFSASSLDTIGSEE